MTQITIEYQLGPEQGIKSFTDQDQAVKFCQDLYDKKLKSQGFTLSKLYGPASLQSYCYGSRKLKDSVKKLPQFKVLAETPLKIKITHSAI